MIVTRKASGTTSHSRGEVPVSVIVPPLAAFGLVLCGVGIVDIGLAWWPLRFGTPEWEFATASRMFDSLALGTTGWVFLVIAATARGAGRSLRVLAALSVIIALVLVSGFGLYWLNVPLALGGIPEQAKLALERSIVRTSLFALLYIGLFGWLSWFTWRRAGVAKGAS